MKKMGGHYWNYAPFFKINAVRNAQGVPKGILRRIKGNNLEQMPARRVIYSGQHKVASCRDSADLKRVFSGSHPSRAHADTKVHPRLALMCSNTPLLDSAGLSSLAHGRSSINGKHSSRFTWKNTMLLHVPARLGTRVFLCVPLGVGPVFIYLIKCFPRDTFKDTERFEFARNQINDDKLSCC